MGIHEEIQAADAMPNCSAQQMVKYGHIWRAFVGLAKDSGNAGDRKLIIDALNVQLDGAGLKVNRGFQAYDPTVRGSGRPKKYIALAETMGGNADGGAGEATAILRWMTGAAGIGTLSDAAKDFAVITHFAEVGRGYTGAPRELADLLRSIAGAKPAAAKQQWAALATTWTPATTYAQDVKSDFVPKKGESQDTDMSTDSSGSETDT